MNEGTGHGGPLHFAAAHLVREGARPGGQTGQIEHFHGAQAGFAGFLPAQEEGEFNVFHRGHGRKQVEKLENHAEPLAAVGGEGGIVCTVEAQAIHRDFPRGRLFEPAEQIEQCAFAASARAGHRGKGARGDLQTHVAQSVHFARG